MRSVEKVRRTPGCRLISWSDGRRTWIPSIGMVLFVALAVLSAFCGQAQAADVGCSSPVVLTAGVPYNGNTTGGSLAINSYGCSSWPEAGPHVVHSLTTNFIHSDITASLTNLTSDLDVFILLNNQCDSATCVAGNTTATYSYAPPGTHYIVVDGYGSDEFGARGPYTLTATAVCRAFDIALGVPYSSETNGLPNHVSSYNCSPWLESGPEVVHRVTTTLTGNLRAELSNLGGVDLDVFILSACTASSCIPGAYGDTVTVYQNAPPGTYYIVVDGFLGAAGPYTLTVTGHPAV